jgi:hypothetical protein
MEEIIGKSMYYLGICQEGLRKTLKKFSQDNRCPFRDSNQTPTVYKSETLPLINLGHAVA